MRSPPTKVSPALGSSLLIGAGLVGGALALREGRKLHASKRLGAAALETLLNAIQANDPVTGDHVRRVAAHALMLAKASGLDEHALRTVELAALFHDIGKISEALFDIMHGAKRLTPATRRAIATHPQKGADVLAPLDQFYPDLSEAVRSHHERWDGGGYPRGLRGSRIPLAARIIAIADTFDAVAHTRPYRKGTGALAALRVIVAGRGTQFDPGLVDVLMIPRVRARLVSGTTRGRKHANARRDAKAPMPAPDVEFRWRREKKPTRARG